MPNLPTPEQFKAYRDQHPDAGVWQTLIALFQITPSDLPSVLLREPVEGPITFASDGEEGQYWLDEETDRAWFYFNGAWRYTSVVSE